MGALFLYVLQLANAHLLLSISQIVTHHEYLIKIYDTENIHLLCGNRDVNTHPQFY